MRFPLTFEPGRRTARLLAAAGVACALSGQAGCTAGAPNQAVTPARSPASSPTAPISPTASGPLLHPEEPVLILTAYRRFWRVAAEVSRQPPQSWRRSLSAVAVEPLLSQLVDGLAEQHAKGLADYGAVVPHPTIVRVDGPRVSILDCQDASRSGTLDVASGVAKTVGAAHTALAAVLDRGLNGQWRLSAARYLDGSC